MFSTRLATLLRPPPVPFTTRVNVPVATFAGSVTVSAEAKLGVPDVVVKTPFAPDGNPDTERVICDLNPFKATTFNLYVTVPPGSAV